MPAAALAHSARLTTRQNQLRIAAFYADHTIAKLEPTVEEPAHRARIDHVLLFQNTRGQPGSVVVGEHRHRRLHHDRTVVELRGHEVDGAAVHLDAGGEGALVSVQARETRAATTGGY